MHVSVSGHHAFVCPGPLYTLGSAEGPRPAQLAEWLRSQTYNHDVLGSNPSGDIVKTGSRLGWETKARSLKTRSKKALLV